MDRKNIILITIDALRADHVTCLGNLKKTTLNIDEMAKKGALFTQAISTGPSTRRSFISMFSSTYASMYGGFRNSSFENRNMIAEILRKQRYSTAAFHSNVLLSSYFNYNRGFDRFEDFFEPAQVKSVFTKLEQAFQKRLKTTFGPALQIVKFIRGNLPYRRAEFINRHALSWLKDCSNKFFLWIHYMDCHFPYLPPTSFAPPTASWWMFFELNFRWRIKASLSKKQLAILTSFYDGEIRYVDDCLGILLNKLKEMGIWLDNTFIILAADHGEEFKDHGRLGHDFRLYDELVHVPLIICGPGIKPKTVVESPVSLIDLSPTILDLLDIQNVPETFLGKSLFHPDRKYRRDKLEGVISEWDCENRRILAYRTKEWKYILTINDQNMRHELYNLQADPKETKEVSHEEEGRCKVFRSKLLEHIRMKERVEWKLREKYRIKKMIKDLKSRGRI